MKSVTSTNISVSAAFALVGLMASACHQAASQETPLSSTESSSINQVWSREDEYTRFEEAGDIDGYKSLFHDKFIGWPCDHEHPLRKADVGQWVIEIRDKQIKETSVLIREGAEDFGNVVVVHYRATGVYTYPDGRTGGEGEEYRITHTWMRTGDTWLIIGGMCADLRDGPE